MVRAAVTISMVNNSTILIRPQKVALINRFSMTRPPATITSTVSGIVSIFFFLMNWINYNPVIEN